MNRTLVDHVITILVFLPAFAFNSWFSVWTYKRNLKRRETKFLKHLRIQNPDSDISLITVETSDGEALKTIREQLDEVCT